MFTTPSPTTASCTNQRLLCRDRMFPTRHVADLPRTCCGLSIDYASETELPVFRRMALDSARRGDNVGLDEYEESGTADASGSKDDALALLINTSEMFVARYSDCGDDGPQAFIAIQPCAYTRTWDTCWATIHIFYSERLHRADEDLFLQFRGTNPCDTPTSSSRPSGSDNNEHSQQSRSPFRPVTTGIYGHLLRLGVEFVGLLELGYTDCMVVVADCCSTRIDAARQLGFVVIATIPSSVDVLGFGIRPDLLIAKSIAYNDRQRRPREQIRELANRSFPADRCDVMYREAELPSISFLPQRYVFEIGLAVTVRAAMKDDDQSIFEIMRATAEAGLGYGVDEFPTFDYFRLSMLLDHTCIVFENESNGEIVGFTIIGKSWYVRTHKSAIFESNLVIRDSYRGLGLGGEASDLELSLAVELGFRASVNDWLGSNLRMARVVRRRQGSRVLTIGTIQRGAYVATPIGSRRAGADGVDDGSWDDQVIIWNDVQASGVLTFTEIADRSRARADARGGGSTSASTSKL